MNVILVIRDGWGYSKKRSPLTGNTPLTDELMRKYPHTLLKASGNAVGISNGYQGNSEVGHLTIGSGRIMLQPLEKINQDIRSGAFFRNKELIGAIKNCKRHRSKLHLIGLLQSEGVHAHENHLYAILDLCKKQKFHDVLIHVITDGRDAPVHDGLKHIRKLIKKMKQTGIGKIATLSGRYYAMDRNQRWERTKKAYECIAGGKGSKFEDIDRQIKECYKKKETDEFIVPRKAVGYEGFEKNDSVIFYNFRTDRTRQLTRAIVEKKFGGWTRRRLNVYFVAMTQFYEPMNGHVAFDKEDSKNILGSVLSSAGMRQLRISETEKYAHVTFFFNDEIETPFPGEDRILIPSPKVSTYDKKPEMSAYKVTSRLVREIKKRKYQFIVVNIVNGDMVGHTGVWKACEKAVGVVDQCVKTIADAGLANQYDLLIFGDHGNMEDKSGKTATSHTTNDVPLIFVSEKPRKLRRGGLVDIAPTVLGLMKIKKPKEMTGKNLCM